MQYSNSAQRRVEHLLGVAPGERVLDTAQAGAPERRRPDALAAQVELQRLRQRRLADRAQHRRPEAGVRQVGAPQRRHPRQPAPAERREEGGEGAHGLAPQVDPDLREDVLDDRRPVLQAGVARQLGAHHRHAARGGQVVQQAQQMGLACAVAPLEEAAGRAAARDQVGEDLALEIGQEVAAADVEQGGGGPAGDAVLGDPFQRLAERRGGGGGAGRRRQGAHDAARGAAGTTKDIVL